MTVDAFVNNASELYYPMELFAKVIFPIRLLEKANSLRKGNLKEYCQC
jgi:hypothetical protein